RTSMAARWDAGGAESSRPGNGSGRARPPRLVFGYGTLVSCPRSTLTYLGVLAPLAALRLLRNRNRLRSSSRLASDAADLRPMSTYFWDRTLDGRGLSAQRPQLGAHVIQLGEIGREPVDAPFARVFGRSVERVDSARAEL